MARGRERNRDRYRAYDDLIRLIRGAEKASQAQPGIVITASELLALWGPHDQHGAGFPEAVNRKAEDETLPPDQPTSPADRNSIGPATASCHELYLKGRYEQPTLNQTDRVMVVARIATCRPH
jgi:hypothetical protein